MKIQVQSLRAVMSVLLITLILCFSATALAAQKYKPGGLYDPCHFTLEIAPEISYIRYVEPQLMHEDGFMYGINGSLIYHGPLFTTPNDTNSWMLRADARGSFGQVDYDGHLMSGAPYEVHNIDDSMLEFRGLVGFDFKNKVARTTPYSGFGYRYLCDDASFDPAGYKRESNYFYVPIGFEVGFPSTSEWSFGATVELDILTLGKQLSHFGGTVGTIKNHQDHGRGFKASLRFQKTQPGLDFGIEPFCRLWDIADSDISQGGLEPANSSAEVGLRLVWGF